MRKKSRKLFISILCIFIILGKNGLYSYAADEKEGQEETRITLTKEEQALIDEGNVYTVGQIRNRYPISNYNEQTGQLEGINEDILNLISQISGLQFQSQPIELDEKPIAALKAGKFDMVAGILSTDKFLHDSQIHLSEPFIESTLSVVTRKGEGFDPQNTYRICMKKFFEAMQDYIQTTYPQYTYQYFSTDEECMRSIQNKETDVMLQNVYVVNYLLQKPQYNDLEIIPATFFTEKNCVAMRSTADERIISIFNKAAADITQEELNRIILANTTAKPYQLTLTDILIKYHIQLAIGSVMLLFCIGMVIAIFHIRSRNLKKIKEKNEQLAMAVRQADYANQAKGQFLSRMSHEIRTPMNAIVGLTNIARNHTDNPAKVVDYLDKIESSSKVLLSIINDILDMPAIENEKLKIAHEEFDIKLILSEIANIYYNQCRQKGIQFVMLTDLPEEILMGDSLRINQVLLNLVSNAFKFTESGGKIIISVKQMNKVENKVFLRFTVSDTGVGMSSEMQNRLFMPFEQETATTAQKHGGSGLGLSIARNLVELMHGAIRVESKKGKGTTFMVDIPLETTGKSTNPDTKKLESIRALVIDDDENAREYTATVLNRIGVQYETAQNGKEAMELIAAAREKGRGFDICFIDWKMPEMDGITVTKKIREIYDEDTIIIIISAYDISEMQDEAIEAGANIFVTKPFFQSTVFNLIMSLGGKDYKKALDVNRKYDFQGKKVLLAEDNMLNKEIAEELLNMANLQVEHVLDGKQALERFNKSEEGRYSLILMDIQMPVMDGYEAAREIRESTHPQAKTIPIYAMTANAFAEDISAALSAGMNGHIAKPIDVTKMYETIEEALKK